MHDVPNKLQCIDLLFFYKIQTYATSKVLLKYMSVFVTSINL